MGDPSGPWPEQSADRNFLSLISSRACEHVRVVHEDTTLPYPGNWRSPERCAGGFVDVRAGLFRVPDLIGRLPACGRGMPASASNQNTERKTTK